MCGRICQHVRILWLQQSEVLYYCLSWTILVLLASGIDSSDSHEILVVLTIVVMNNIYGLVGVVIG